MWRSPAPPRRPSSGGKSPPPRSDGARPPPHFDKAARLDPVYDHLKQAGIFTRRAGRYATALRHLEDLLELSRREYGERSPKTAAALNDLANLLNDMDRRREAERLYRQALEIGRETLGEGHPAYANWLNNLATLLTITDRRDEAEPLYRQALEIGRETLGEGHPAYAFGSTTSPLF